MKKNLKNIWLKFRFVNSKGYYLNIKPNNDEDKNINQDKEDDYLRSRFQQHLPRWFLLPRSCKCRWREVQQKLHKQKTSDPISQRIAKRIIAACHTLDQKPDHNKWYGSFGIN